ncbi:uncharacterized protein LOC133925073 [Phragmites australis]|uniref:uncharacterized protein LOC133925073 n=1 Tax=Phragmites australis TaxID=29695 RepID=UPI002D78D096|nr:uncharacterized protein LOC133925073 [Phragmites australis]
MQHIISACKPRHSQPAAALLPPRPLLRRAAFLCLPVRAREATSPLVVRRRCQEEGKRQQQEGEEEGQRRSFLSLEEAGLVEMSGLSTHERFLCRLTISSLNLLRVISEQEGVPIEKLNAGRVCDWFLKDKLKREQNVGSAVLQWDDHGF